MKNVLITVFFSVTSFHLAAQTKEIAADNAAIGYTGRFDFTDPAEPVFMYSGCMIRTGFTGTSITVKLVDDSLRNWFTIHLDDSLFVLKADNKDGIYLLAENLENKKHSLEISRRTEAHGGNTRFGGLLIDENAGVFPLPGKKRTIEFIGNSVTCGYGNEGTSREEHFSYATENGYLGFGAITARALNANYVAVCRSGIGMYQDYGGDTGFVQPRLYDEIVAGSKAVWDYNKHQPDVVVIELGANDLEKPLDSLAFTNAYIRFVKKIRKQYSKAKIICAAGPDLPEQKSDRFQNYVQAVARHFKTSDKNVFYFYFGIVDANGSDWHPNLEEHRQMAAALLPYIKKITGW